jgi:alpha-tubulin suppressor-like RCC1 family protein
LINQNALKVEKNQSVGSKYENNQEECRKLTKYIQDNQKFILCFGANKDGELGITNIKENIKEPRALQCTEDLNSAQSISSGSHHSALVTKSGEIFVSGSSLHGKLGIADLGVPNVCKFTILPSMQATVKSIACGDYHTLALTKEGVVYSWGGSLHKKSSGTLEPQLVQSLID